MDYNNEYLDSRDLNERLEELNELTLNEDGERDDTLYNDLSNEEREELEMLEKLKDETEWAGWEYGINFIKEYNFKDYAEELFDDCFLYNAPENVRHYIDYDKFANDLEMDYTEVEIDGTSYLFRE